jgi:SAM-dependent methyltransferase
VLFRSLYRRAITFDTEARIIVDMVKRASAAAEGRARILDVGCGYGRNLRALNGAGLSVTGVELNEEIVTANRRSGLACMTVAEFEASAARYDVVLMSHVIEHFAPAALVVFMDGYLDRLETGGRLVIATPLLTDYFFDDFDHVKPYHPIGLLMVFGEDRAQVQYYARNRLALEDIWVRRSPLRLGHSRSRYMLSWRTRARQTVEFFSALAFRASFGWIGAADGWVATFRKIKSGPSLTGGPAR